MDNTENIENTENTENHNFPYFPQFSGLSVLIYWIIRIFHILAGVMTMDAFIPRYSLKRLEIGYLVVKSDRCA